MSSDKILYMSSSVEAYLQKHLRFNFIVGMFDGGFFGFGIGFASFAAIIPPLRQPTHPFSITYRIGTSDPQRLLAIASIGLADAASFSATFVISAICGLLMTGALWFVMKDPTKEN